MRTSGFPLTWLPTDEVDGRTRVLVRGGEIVLEGGHGGCDRGGGGRRCESGFVAF